MPKTIDIGEAKARLSHLIASAEAGRVVIIVRNGVPAAGIVPLNRLFEHTTASLSEERARRRQIRPIKDTIALLLEERARRPRVTAREVREDIEQGCA